MLLVLVLRLLHWTTINMGCSMIETRWRYHLMLLRVSENMLMGAHMTPRTAASTSSSTRSALIGHVRRTVRWDHGYRYRVMTRTTACAGQCIK